MGEGKDRLRAVGSKCAHWIAYCGNSLSHLDSGFGQADPHRQFFAHKDVRIVCFGETSLQLLKLSWRKTGPVTLLFASFEVVMAVVLMIEVSMALTVGVDAVAYCLIGHQFCCR